MNKPSPLLLTVLVHYNNPDECIQLVHELAQVKDIRHHIVVVDNQSKTDYYLHLKAQLTATSADLIQNNINGGYGSGINLGVTFGEKYSPDYIQVLNTDVSISNVNYLKEILTIMESDQTIGLIGPAVKMLNGAIQNTVLPQVSLKSALFFSKIAIQRSTREETPKLYPADVINGVCMIIRYKDFKKINGFDTDFFMYGEEQEFCYRLKNIGSKLYFWSGESIVHFEKHNTELAKEVSWRDLLVRANQVLALKKHTPLLFPILSLLFATSLLVKRLRGFKYSSIPLFTSLVYMFWPEKLNRFFMNNGK